MTTAEQVRLEESRDQKINWKTWGPYPSLEQIEGAPGTRVVAVTHPKLGKFTFSCDGDAPLLFTVEFRPKRG